MSSDSQRKCHLSIKWRLSCSQGLLVTTAAEKTTLHLKWLLCPTQNPVPGLTIDWGETKQSRRISLELKNIASISPSPSTACGSSAWFKALAPWCVISPWPHHLLRAFSRCMTAWTIIRDLQHHIHAAWDPLIWIKMAMRTYVKDHFATLITNTTGGEKGSPWLMWNWGLILLFEFAISNILGIHAHIASIFHAHVLMRGVMILVQIHGKEDVLKRNDPWQQRFFRKTWTSKKILKKCYY